MKTSNVPQVSLEPVAILGAGSWGTAIAIHLAQQGLKVFLWGKQESTIQAMQKMRCNQRYLPEISFPPSLEPCTDLATCCEHAKQIILAVPSHAFEKILNQLPQHISSLAWLTKGLDPKGHRLLSQLVTEKWNDDFPHAVIAGPSFAREVAKNLPTAMILAGHNLNYLESLRELFHHHNMRIYLSQDTIGVQLCGAVKNVLAIACGISDGLGFGANAKAALITRGLAEMRRLGLKLGASTETFLGLAGVGDLVLTCTDDQSRNRRFGLELGRGASANEAEKNINQVVEGKYNAAQVCQLAEQHHVDMPICQAVHAVLHEKVTPRQAVSELMSRPPKLEI